MASPQRQLLLDDRSLARTLQRMALDILQKTPSAHHHELLLVGIQRRGVELAMRIAARIEQETGGTVPRGSLDITLYRDDLEAVGPRPLVGPTSLPTDIEGRQVWIV